MRQRFTATSVRFVIFSALDLDDIICQANDVSVLSRPRKDCPHLVDDTVASRFNVDVCVSPLAEFTHVATPLRSALCWNRRRCHKYMDPVHGDAVSPEQPQAGLTESLRTVEARDAYLVVDLVAALQVVEKVRHGPGFQGLLMDPNVFVTLTGCPIRHGGCNERQLTYSARRGTAGRDSEDLETLLRVASTVRLRQCVDVV